MGAFLAGLLLGILVGAAGTLMYTKRKKRPRPTPAKPTPTTTPRVSLDDIVGAGSQDDRVEQLRQNLRLKYMYDEEKMERAIAFERERQPQAPPEEHLQAAIERWERDNR